MEHSEHHCKRFWGWHFLRHFSAISNFALSILNSASGQTLDFKINNTGYMQMYPNGVVNIGMNQIFNEQLVLYDDSTSDTPSTATNFNGFGVNNHILRYCVQLHCQPMLQQHIVAA
jgi:hypothetical protein